MVESYILLSDEDESYFQYFYDIWSIFIEENVLLKMYNLMNEYGDCKDIVMKIISVISSFTYKIV